MKKMLLAIILVLAFASTVDAHPRRFFYRDCSPRYNHVIISRPYYPPVYYQPYPSYPIRYYNYVPCNRPSYRFYYYRR